ncbi:MAG: glycoside hydrolase family 2 TIM barrel-domain containing protein, partial [Melioribacteraceae bacterium]|nr:glycoside hydrolase family 2 TIM barrel-domain containing protein [Melioribacteraceae bacterium]
MKNTISIALLVLIILSVLPNCSSIPKSSGMEELNYLNKQYELKADWVCKNIKEVTLTGEELSKTSSSLSGWLPATVPGTVLTTLLNNQLIPDPFYGMNNEKIPDIYEIGSDHYTYWFVKDFQEQLPPDDTQIWLHFRGINYGCDIFLNGYQLNDKTHYGMFLRQTFNITPFLAKEGNNRLAVIVYPPDPVGNPNGGQGGDGTIARNVTNQYVAGWDWIQPIRDRNTGIWDKVIIEKTNGIRIKDPHVISLVPGKRFPGKPQAPAVIKASTTIDNPTDMTIEGSIQLAVGNEFITKDVSIVSNTSAEIKLPDIILKDPELWWPNGYRKQPMYEVKLQFVGNDGRLLDENIVRTGIREIQTSWNDHTRSMEVLVNGQKIFIKGGNWIASDAMLRLSHERYDAEVRFHRDMNLNLIRIWGGSLTERPEFYDACDKYGLLVMQDFWMSGDCNGKWFDPKKKEDQWTRRKYPNDHDLFLNSVIDQVKMIRNHPSLAFYCGGNEIPPPKNILTVMVDSLLPALDSTRYFFEYSNADSMSYNFIGGNGDGPYHIQPVRNFWEKRSFPFNSEIGSVGIGDYNSLKRFIPEDNLVLPGRSWKNMDSVWRYHRPSWYGQNIDKYGKPKNLADFARKAQLVNYNQYRGLLEGHISHMWDWYTGL